MVCVDYEDLAIFCNQCIAMLEAEPVGSDEWKKKLCPECKAKHDRYCAVCQHLFENTAFVIENCCVDCRQTGTQQLEIVFHDTEHDKFFSLEEMQEANKDNMTVMNWLETAKPGSFHADGIGGVTVNALHYPSILFMYPAKMRQK